MDSFKPARINFAKDMLEELGTDLQFTKTDNPDSKVILRDADGNPISKTETLGNQLIKVTSLLPNGSIKLQYLHYSQLSLSVSIEKDGAK
ncbi:hypothetical protein [Secundilactobacillus muriivasis]